MKKQLVVALGLTVLATPAFASKARLQALGEDTYGSFYVNDNRNVFYNAAQVNNHKDLVTFEFGDTTANNATSGVDSTESPRAEGGVFKSMGNLVYGVYLGSESNTGNGFRAASAVNLAQASEENNIDLFVAGDAGVKWGANLTYSKSGKDEKAGVGDASQEAIRTRLGVIAGDIEGFANINITNKAEDSNGDEFKGKLGFQVGAIYNINDYRAFAEYRDFSGEAKGTQDGDLKASQLQVGAGRTSKLNDKATLFTKAQFQMNKGSNDTALAGTVGTLDGVSGCSLAGAVACEEYKAMFVPVVVGLEYDAASWLVLRGSVSQTVWGKEEDKDDSRPFHNTTVVNAGATLKFGELSVDGVIGNSASGAAASGTDTSEGAGNLRTDNLMSRVSMTYRF